MLELEYKGCGNCLHCYAGRDNHGDGLYYTCHRMPITHQGFPRTVKQNCCSKWEPNEVTCRMQAHTSTDELGKYFHLQSALSELNETIAVLYEACHQVAEGQCCQTPGCSIEEPYCDTMICRAAIMEMSKLYTNAKVHYNIYFQDPEGTIPATKDGDPVACVRQGSRIVFQQFDLENRPVLNKPGTNNEGELS